MLRAVHRAAEHRHPPLGVNRGRGSLVGTGGRLVPDTRISRHRRILVTLCLTQITGWGVLFYAFPVLQGSIADDTGWSRPWVAGAFTLGQVTAAAAGVAVGHVLDRRGPHLVMSAGSVLAVAAVLLVSGADSRTAFAAAWLLAGLSMAAVLYPPAFAAVTGWFEGRARMRALTVLTVVGGLASTVFAPLTAWLEGELGWRGAYLVLAGLLAMTFPAHWWGLRAAWPRQRHAARGQGPAAVLRSRAFLALAAALAVTAFCSTAAVVHLVPLLHERGVGLGTASTVLALGGVGQVVGRIGYGQVAARLGAGARVAAVLGTLTVTTALLGVVEAMYVVVVVVLVAGAARGALTLLRATVVTDRWGVAHYARLTGLMSLPVALAAAVAPWAGAALADRLGSYGAAFVVLAGVNIVAVVLAAATRAREVGPDIDVCQH